MKTITLLDAETMTTRLLKVLDDPHAQQRFSPKLIAHAGAKLVAPGLVMAIQRAIADYTEGMPTSMAAIMEMCVPALVDAMTDDADVAAEAKAFHADVLASMCAK